MKSSRKNTDKLQTSWFYSTGSSMKEAPDHSSVERVDGQKISYSLQQSTRQHQQDRLAVFAIPAEKHAQLAGSAAEVLDGAVEAAKLKCGRTPEAGSTMMLVHYDPESYSVDLRSIGDSLAYLVVEGKDEKGKAQALTIKISSTAHECFVRINKESASYMVHTTEYPVKAEPGEVLIQTSMMRNALGPDVDTCLVLDGHVLPSVLGASYHLHDHDLNSKGVYDGQGRFYPCDDMGLPASELRNGRIDLHAFKKEAAARFGFTESSIRLSLLVTSDGLEKKLSRKEIANEYAKHHDVGAMAETVARIGGPGSDNISIIALDALAQGKGRPLYALVCDGFDGGRRPRGQLCAQEAVNAVKEYMKQKFRLPPALDVGRA